MIVASDHGESFGEHPGVFCHGMSLYQTEVHVPSVIVPPGSLAMPRVVAETVSLRDLAATIVDVAGFEDRLPFPGESLAGSGTGRAADPATSDRALAEVVPTDSFTRDPVARPRAGLRRWPPSPRATGPTSAVEGEVREELFHVPRMPTSQQNLAGDPAAQPTLERMRRSLGRLTNGPLTPRRFRP